MTADISLSRIVGVVPVKDVGVARDFYVEKLGFTFFFEEGTYMGVGRGDVELHLNGYAAATAGSGVVRFQVSGLDELHAAYDAAGVVDPDEQLRTEPWGMRQFGVRDADGNQLMFFTPA